LEVRDRSDAADVKSGRPRANITSISDIKTDWRCGARNVQIKLRTSVAGCGLLCGIEMNKGFCKMEVRHTLKRKPKN